MKSLGIILGSLLALSLITPVVAGDYDLNELGCVAVDAAVSFYQQNIPDVVIVNFITDTDGLESHVYLAAPVQPTVLKLNFNSDGCLISDAELTFEEYDLEAKGV